MMARSSLVAQTLKNPPAMRETWARSLGWEDPQRKDSKPSSEFLPGEFHGQGSLVGTLHGVTKSQTQLSD